MTEVRLPQAMRDGSVLIPTVWVVLAEAILRDERESDAALALASQIVRAAEATASK